MTIAIGSLAPPPNMDLSDNAVEDTIIFDPRVNGTRPSSGLLDDRMLNAVANLGSEQAKLTAQMNNPALPALELQKLGAQYQTNVTVITAAAKTFVNTVKTVTQSS